MTAITDDDVNRMWHSDVAWTKINYHRLRGDRVSLTASATFARPPANKVAHARAVRKARLAYVEALAAQVHPGP